MFLMNHDFFDRFDVSFTKKESIINGKVYPLGYFANEVLEMDQSILREIANTVETFKYEFHIFLANRSVTSAALSHEALLFLWNLLSNLPVYEKISGHHFQVQHLISYMREHPDEVDDMLTVGTERNQMLNLWLYHLEHLTPSIRNFIQKTDFMLEDYFENLLSRKPESYVMAYAKYKRDIRNGYDLADQEDEDTTELDLHQLTFPFSLSYEPKIHPQTQEPFLAEVMTFGTLESFLYTDLMKAISAGNVPRKCHNCKKYFLAVGGYDTVYCERIAPHEQTKTCRKVGAHKKEKEKNGSSMIQKEYNRVYNRLKTRKNRGKISNDQWNEQVSLAQDLKDKANRGELSDAAYTSLMDNI